MLTRYRGNFLEGTVLQNVSKNDVQGCWEFWPISELNPWQFFVVKNGILFLVPKKLYGDFLLQIFVIRHNG